MPTDYYDDSAESDSAPSKETKSKGDDGSATALLPLSFFPEKPEPGKVCSIKVEKIYDDQASVTYVKSDKSESEEEPEMEEPSDMDEMMA